MERIADAVARRRAVRISGSLSMMPPPTAPLRYPTLAERIGFLRVVNRDSATPDGSNKGVWRRPLRREPLT